MRDKINQLVFRNAIRKAQAFTIEESLHEARQYSYAGRLMDELVGSRTGGRSHRLAKFAFLNRACELACAPVHIRPVETSHGLDYALYTYRPVAQEPKRFLGNGESRPNRLNRDLDLEWHSVSAPSEIEPVYLGLETDLTEDQARSKAMGW